MNIEWPNYDNYFSEAREAWKALADIKADTRKWSDELWAEIANDLVVLLQWDGLEIKSGDQLWYLNALLPFWYRINFIAEVAQNIRPGDTVVLDGEDVVVHRWDDCKTIGTCIAPNIKTEKIWEVDLWEEEKIEYTIQAWDILSRVVNKNWVDQEVSWIREWGQLLADSLGVEDRVLIDTQAGEIHVNNILVGTFTAKEKSEQVRKHGEVMLEEVLVEPVEIDFKKSVVEVRENKEAEVKLETELEKAEAVTATNQVENTESVEIERPQNTKKIPTPKYHLKEYTEKPKEYKIWEKNPNNAQTIFNAFAQAKKWFSWEPIINTWVTKSESNRINAETARRNKEKENEAIKLLGRY